MPYKIQTMSKNSQQYYTTKRLKRDLLSNTPNCYIRAVLQARANFVDIYLREMRDRSMRSGTELAREIQLTDWSIVESTSYQQNPVNLLKITEKCLKSSINNRYNTNLSVRVRIPVRVLGVNGCPVSDLTSA